MQARGDRQRRGGNRDCSLYRFQLAPGFQHGLCHLLHEQRDAVSTLDDVLSNARRQRLVADDAVDHGVDLAMSQPVEGKSCDVRLSDPGRLELRPERHDQQRAKARDLIHHATECFQARRVAPVRILEDQEHGAGARQGFQLYAECLQRLLPALFGNWLQSGVASVVRKRQHLGQQRRVLPGRRGLRQ